ncbi:MAG: hypothetical protein EOP61_39375 [Sphingomonadales bacterium]|nr:MAG: hypothetical protein EOP61_39375 [Sphingomonadales bacterium]
MLPSRLPLSGSDKVVPGPSPSDNPDEEPAIVVTAQPRGGCRVRLADRTLTNAQLAAKAKEWAASGTALKLVRPRGADYRCLARITWQLGQYGLRLFQFVDASEAYAEPKPAQKPNR